KRPLPFSLRPAAAGAVPDFAPVGPSFGTGPTAPPAPAGGRESGPSFPGAGKGPSPDRANFSSPAPASPRRAVYGTQTASAPRLSTSALAANRPDRRRTLAGTSLCRFPPAIGAASPLPPF